MEDDSQVYLGKSSMQETPKMVQLDDDTVGVMLVEMKASRRVMEDQMKLLSTLDQGLMVSEGVMAASEKSHRKKAQAKAQAMLQSAATASRMVKDPSDVYLYGYLLGRRQ